MPEPTDQPAKPLRTWRPMAWTILFSIIMSTGCGQPRLQTSQPQTLLDGPKSADLTATVQLEAEPKPEIPVLRWPPQGNLRDFIGLIVPIFQAHEAVVRFENSTGAVNDLCAAAIDRLGGQQAAACKLTLYVRYTRPSLERRYLLLAILDRSGREHPVPGLVLLLKDPEMGADMRAHIVHLLSDEHGGPWSVAPLIEALLKDGEAKVRAKAAEELRFLAYEDQHGIAAALDQAAKDKDESVRAAAAEALKKIRGEEAGK